MLPECTILFVFKMTISLDERSVPLSVYFVSKLSFFPLHLDWWIGPWLWSFLVHRGHYESNSEVAAIQPFFLLLILPPRCVCHSGWVVFSHFEIAFSLPAIFYACQVEKKELRWWVRRDSRPLLIAQRDDDEYSTRWDDFPMHCSFTKKEDFFLSKIK